MRRHDATVPLSRPATVEVGHGSTASPVGPQIAAQCPARLGDLPCTRTDDHDPDKRGGHVYVSSAASHLGEGAHHGTEPNE